MARPERSRRADQRRCVPDSPQEAFLHFAEHAATLGVSLDADAVARLRHYCDLLLLWNRSVPLVSRAGTAAEIVCKHFLDSLALVPELSPGENLADIGSGAGFPGLPLAIVRPDVSATLFESNRRKASFLLEVASRLTLPNVTVLETRVEAALETSEHRGRYSAVVSRAFGPLADFLRLASGLLRPVGRAIAMKGPRLEEELAALTLVDFGMGAGSIRRYRLPDGSPRSLLFLRRLES
jgi:16S rRNA (guanine527-N7)-methyltransferase